MTDSDPQIQTQKISVIIFLFYRGGYYVLGVIIQKRNDVIMVTFFRPPVIIEKIIIKIIIIINCIIKDYTNHFVIQFFLFWYRLLENKCKTWKDT